MIVEYVNAALAKAKYEKIDNGKEPYYGEVPALKGVWATGRILEECRAQLLAVIEGWLIVRLRKGLAIPPIGRTRIETGRALRVGT